MYRIVVLHRVWCLLVVRPISVHLFVVLVQVLQVVVLSVLFVLTSFSMNMVMIVVCSFLRVDVAQIVSVFVELH